jgi:formimidoylglutamate deiminase
MLEGALAAGPVASGQATGGIAVGQRADFCVLDTQSPALLGIPADHMLDALVFSSPDARFDAVYVAGQLARLHNSGNFVSAMRALWGV